MALVGLLIFTKFKKESYKGIVIQTPLGQIHGEKRENVSVFKAVPYALPPTGERRWQPPAPITPWSSPLDATKLGPACVQTKEDLQAHKLTVPTSEDCLHLNIWTPDLKKKLPVMVWIHGGGFKRGSNASEVYDGFKMAKQGELVFVSINYRLGRFSFFAHPALTQESPHKASGNYGLMDQIEALKWVKNNISSFGGDPENITLAGASAGGFSICSLITSPLVHSLSKRLFERIIMQSGSCGSNYSNLKESEDIGQETAEGLGCRGQNALSCLRKMTPEQILSFQQPTFYFPNIDGYVLQKSPSEALQEHLDIHMPLLIGTTAEEGDTHLFPDTINSAEDLLKIAQERWPKNADKITSYYLKQFNNQPHRAYLEMMSDSLFTCPSKKIAQTFAERGAAVYNYLFSFQPTDGTTQLTAHHSSELPFVFGSPKNPQEQWLSDAMMGAWSQFAKGAPALFVQNQEWPKFETTNEQTINFGKKIQSQQHLKKEICSLL